MSVWPEAVWIVREMQSALGAETRIQELSDRLTLIESRYLIVSTGDTIPDAAPISPSGRYDGSLWFKIFS